MGDPPKNARPLNHLLSCFIVRGTETSRYLHSVFRHSLEDSVMIAREQFTDRQRETKKEAEIKTGKEAEKLG